MATDIAFTLGILTMFGSRIPLPLKVFFTALAIADDLGAILVIAVFYSADISLIALGVAAVFLVALDYPQPGTGLLAATVRRTRRRPVAGLPGIGHPSHHRRRFAGR